MCERREEEGERGRCERGVCVCKGKYVHIDVCVCLGERMCVHVCMRIDRRLFMHKEQAVEGK